MSVTSTLSASDGPRFLTSNTYRLVVPASISSGDVFVIVTSASCSGVRVTVLVLLPAFGSVVFTLDTVAVFVTGPGLIRCDGDVHGDP